MGLVSTCDVRESRNSSSLPSKWAEGSAHLFLLYRIAELQDNLLELVAIATIEATQQVDAKDDVNKALREYGKYI